MFPTLPQYKAPEPGSSVFSAETLQLACITLISPAHIQSSPCTVTANTRTDISRDFNLQILFQIAFILLNPNGTSTCDWPFSSELRHPFQAPAWLCLLVQWVSASSTYSPWTARKYSLWSPHHSQFLHSRILGLDSVACSQPSHASWDLLAYTRHLCGTRNYDKRHPCPSGMIARIQAT